MRAKEFLWQLKEKNSLTETYREEYDRLMDRATDISVKFNDVMARSGEQGSKQELACVKMVELAERYDKEWKKLAELEEKAMKVIRKLKPLKYQTVLIKYYIQNKTFEQTAVEMGITYRWVCEIHRQALQAYEEVEREVS